jgi:hypothetical protein
MKMKTRFGILFLLFLLINLMNVLIYHHGNSMFLTKLESPSCRITGDRWIITTAVSSNPETIRNILSIQGWQCMIVGDKNTPKNWVKQFLATNLWLVSYEELSSSGFRLAAYLAYGLNTQKNIGYLMAIVCGAKIIYELDGNSLIPDSDIKLNSYIQSSEDIPWIAFRSLKSLFINVYAIFGQPQIWPRGIPLSELQNISEGGWSSLRRNDNESINGYIVQNLFNFESDVDSVARLTRPLSVSDPKFEHERRSIAVEAFTFSPYNSLNTIHYEAAFWGLYLPVTVNIQVADIWRSFWVQRLLWDIDGQVVFSTSNVKRYKRLKSTNEDMQNEHMIHQNGTNFVQFLNSWVSTFTLFEDTLIGLIDALKNAQLINSLESVIMRDWLIDLSNIKYRYPTIKKQTQRIPPTHHVKRAAVCLTGLTECVQEVWASNEMKLRQRLNGEIDIFLILSSGHETMVDHHSIAYATRIKQARFYNATVNIVFEDTVDINPAFPPTCKYNYGFTYRRKIIPIEYERYAQANCYQIVKEYERKRRIRYQLLIRARADAVFTRLPTTFERTGDYNVNSTIIVPDEHHYYGINDRFAIGPIDSMRHYMCRWFELAHCHTENVHPETFLAYILHKNDLKVTKDIQVSLTQVPHNERQCH